MPRKAAERQTNDSDWRDQPEREFSYSWADFEQARTLIRQRAGVALADHKHHLVYSRLSKRLRALGKQSFAEYLTMLTRDPNHPEWQDFTSSLTTHLTSFFREPHHFELLGQYLEEHRGRPIRIWCAAASTGEEPYSIAMTVAERYKGGLQNVSISATDIDIRGLATAEAAIYATSRVERLPQERLKRHFLRGTAANHGYVRVRPELQRMVRFFRLNLQDTHWPIEGRFDLIFCRNVMIYFEREEQHRLIARLTGKLTHEGILFLGHSENAQCMGKQLRLAGKTAYRLNHPEGVIR